MFSLVFWHKRICNSGYHISHVSHTRAQFARLYTHFGCCVDETHSNRQHTYPHFQLAFLAIHCVRNCNNNKPNGITTEHMPMEWSKKKKNSKLDMFIYFVCIKRIHCSLFRSRKPKFICKRIILRNVVRIFIIKICLQPKSNHTNLSILFFILNMYIFRSEFSLFCVSEMKTTEMITKAIFNQNIFVSEWFYAIVCYTRWWHKRRILLRAVIVFPEIIIIRKDTNSFRSLSLSPIEQTK